MLDPKTTTTVSKWQGSLTHMYLPTEIQQIILCVIDEIEGLRLRNSHRVALSMTS